MAFNNAVNASQEGVQYINPTGTWSGLDGGASGQVLTSNGTGVAPSFQANPGTGAITTINGDSGSISGSTVTIDGGSTGLTTSNSGSTSHLIGTLNVSHGGTGATTLTGVVTGNGTSAFTASAITQHDVLVGGASNAITSIAPSATTGVPLVSQGAAADPAFGTTSIAGGGTNATSFAITDGTIYYDGTKLVTTATGTSGQVLTSNGAGVAPTYQTLTSGSLVLIQTKTASNSASISFTSGLTTYNNLLIVFDNVVPISNGVSLQMQISTNGGSSYVATGYASGYNQLNFSSTVPTNANSSTAFLLGGVFTNTAGDSAGGSFYLGDITSGAAIKLWGTSVLSISTSSFQNQLVGKNSTTGTNAIQFTFTSGNISTGTFSVYGITS